jgi:hypothetical protein
MAHASECHRFMPRFRRKIHLLCGSTGVSLLQVQVAVGCLAQERLSPNLRAMSRISSVVRPFGKWYNFL